MKAIIFLCCMTAFSFSPTGVLSQNSNIRIKADITLTVDEVFDLIMDQTDYKFIYQEGVFDSFPKVFLNKGKIKTNELLRKSLSTGNFKIMVTENNTVLVQERPVKEKIKNQNPEISGTVTDQNGQPLPGTSILEKGTTNGTQTDFDGKFSLSVSNEKAVLVISYVGFLSQEVTIDGKTDIAVTLQEDAAELEEVVVVAYGTVKKSDLTGSVTSIKSEEIAETPSVRLDDALRGRAAGLQVVPTSSQPGAAASIRIRGTNSITGNSNPLFVIDGLIGTGNTSDLNIQDIESVEILKDASATALYGSRASAGVVLITTKRGKKGKMTLKYDSFVSTSSPLRLIPFLNAAEYGAFQNEVQNTDAYPNPESLGEGTNWQKEVYRNNALTFSNTLSISGGNDNAQYYLSANHFDQDGIYFEGNLKRYQIRLNGDFKLGEKLKIGNSIVITRNYTLPGSSDIINIGGYFPTLPVRDENGEFTIQTVSSELSAENPIGGPTKSINENTRSRIYGTIYAELELFKNLKYKLSYGTDLSLSKSENYAPSTLFGQQNIGGTATISNSEFLSTLIEQTLNYNVSLGKHNINALAGYTRQRFFNSGSLVGVRGFTTDFFTFNNIDAGTDRFRAESNASESGIESMLFRLNYNFDGKYRLTLSGRRDGATAFAASEKYGFFPSVAIAWTASKEKFIKDLNVFSDLKFRSSFGTLGNPAAGGSSLARLGAGFTYLFGNSGGISNGIGLNRLGNDKLKFESTDQLDVGVDMGFFNNRLRVTLDYYKKKTRDLFTSEDILWLAGVPNSSIPTNFGTVENQGFELFVNSVNVDSKDFTWETSFNISTNKNKVLSIPDEDGQVLINRFGGVVNVPSAVIEVGQPLGAFYGFVRNGIWHTQEEIDAAGLNGRGVFPGGKRFEDISGPDGVPDGVIDNLDQRIIGDPNPDFYGGINNTIRFKNFDFSMYWAFTVGNDIFNETDSRVNTAFDNNVFKKFANRWTPSNTDTDVPSVRGIFRSEIVSETGVLEDGSFLRLRNISLGYNLPIEKLSKLPFSKARLYISGTNLLLFDNYSGYDPEINRGNSNIRRGYDQAQDPSAKTWTVGLNLTF
ncbi:SusC/RagA family TonB-linked outer membrane protein [Aestuariivivens insulae]|uniref:SusC/RagA family TonB-linked outer membrane protein n=1 Tax=Aestuariivivens insulae TaxID=1621988 RepID=UPI001F598FD9|nr:TonB-dependent receptor [Aestuariivivens insulae]